MVSTAFRPAPVRPTSPPSYADQPAPEAAEVAPRRSATRRTTALVAELTVAPIVLFTLAVHVAGMRTAVLVPPTWMLIAVARRLARGHRVPGLLALGVVTSTSKAALPLLTGNLSLYLLQPTITSAALGLAFALSIPLGRPLAHRIVRDITGTDEATHHGRCSPFLVRATAVWAAVKLTNAAIGLWLYCTTSPASLVATRTACCWAVTALGAALIAALWQRSRHESPRRSVRRMPLALLAPVATPRACPLAA
jgi:hypothetical protein